MRELEKSVPAPDAKRGVGGKSQGLGTPGCPWQLQALHTCLFPVLHLRIEQPALIRTPMEGATAVSDFCSFIMSD